MKTARNVLAVAVALAAGLCGAARAWDNVEDLKGGSEAAYVGDFSLGKLKGAAKAMPGVKSAEEASTAGGGPFDAAADRFCRQWGDSGALSSLMTNHCMKAIANRSFDPAALKVCGRYGSYFPEVRCLGIIANHSFDRHALDVCDTLFESVALTNQCLEVIANRSDPKTLESIDVCGRYAYWRAKSDRWKSKCLDHAAAGEPVSETDGLKEKDDTKIGFLGLKRFLVGVAPDPILDAYLEAKFRLEHNLGSGEGWEHDRRFEALKERYLRDLEEGRKLRKGE